MDDEYLNGTEEYVENCKITFMQYYSFLLFSLTVFNQDDEIRILIQIMDSYMLPRES